MPQDQQNDAKAASLFKFQKFIVIQKDPSDRPARYKPKSVAQKKTSPKKVAKKKPSAQQPPSKKAFSPDLRPGKERLQLALDTFNLFIKQVETHVIDPIKLDQVTYIFSCSIDCLFFLSL